MENIISAISTVGFPIFSSIALSWGLWKMYLKMTETLDIITDTNRELVLTNSSLIKNIDSKVDKLEIKVDKLIDRI